MTLDQLDKLLAEWKARTGSATSGLLALRALPTYEILTGQCQLTGITAQKATPALQVLDGVWRDYGLVTATVDQAHALRSSLPRFTGVQQRVDEIALVLTGASIPCATEVTLSTQDLSTTGTGQSLTLLQLFDRMNAAFVHARDVILEIDAAWKTLDANLQPACTFLDSHANETAFGIPALRRAIDDLKPRVMPDPLGAADEFNHRVAPALAQTRTAVEELDRRRAAFGPDLANAHAMLERLIALHSESEATFHERREKVTGCASAELPVPAQRISLVTARMGQIPGKAITAFLCSELAQCTEEIRLLTSAEEQILSKNQAPLDLRRELRGRLSAMKAKAVGRGRAEDRELVALADRANQLLYSRPTPIDQALATVAQYEARLNNPERK